MTQTDLEILSFNSQADFRIWLEKNYTLESGIYIRIFKKHSGKLTITHAQALDEALCFGWIDGVRKSYDTESFLQKFTPRRKASLWSKVNIGHVERLIKADKMQPSGYAEIERAKTDGRWQHAYDSPKNMVIPEDFIDELKKDINAYEFFQTLNKANLFAIGWRLQTAKKPETRERRKQVLLQMLKDGKLLH